MGNAQQKCFDLFDADSITKISGVHDIRAVKCNEKTVYLVGERHSREGLCQDEGDGVISVNDYLKQITERLHNQGKSFDMFVEEDYVYKTSKKKRGENQMNEQTLLGLRAYVQNFRVDHPNSTVRIHYTDVRDFLGALPYFVPGSSTNAISALLNSVIPYRGKSDYFRQDFVLMLDEMYVHPLYNYITSKGLRVGNVLEKQARKSSLNPGEISTLLDVFHQRLRSYKEQKEYYLNYNVEQIVNYMVKRHLTTREAWYKENGSLSVDPTEPTKEDNIDLTRALADAIQLLWVTVHDLYTVFRMFKPYTANCSLFYGGSNHTESICELLQLLGGKVEKFITAPSSSWSCLTLSGGAKYSGVKKTIRSLEAKCKGRRLRERRWFNSLLK